MESEKFMFSVHNAKYLNNWKKKRKGPSFCRQSYYLEHIFNCKKNVAKLRIVSSLLFVIYMLEYTL